ncbi:hypothetical protein C8J56DRAFT_887011 [Mycena floridula]|nr:hypothetical protein C8J56DRAFT_887011 [Mycena floridula]
MSEAMQSSPLADSDIFILKETLIEIAVQLLLYGIYSVLVLIVLYKLWTNKARLAARHILIAAAISMFVANTIQISLDLASSLIQLPTLGFDPPNVEDSSGKTHIMIEDSMINVTLVAWSRGPLFIVTRSKGSHYGSSP